MFEKLEVFATQEEQWKPYVRWERLVTKHLLWHFWSLPGLTTCQRHPRWALYTPSAARCARNQYAKVRSILVTIFPTVSIAHSPNNQSVLVASCKRKKKKEKKEKKTKVGHSWTRKWRTQKDSTATTFLLSHQNNRKRDDTERKRTKAWSVFVRRKVGRKIAQHYDDVYFWKKAIRYDKAHIVVISYQSTEQGIPFSFCRFSLKRFPMHVKMVHCGEKDTPLS